VLFQDKVVIVTGAARGIGKSIAAAFAQEGAKVAVVDMNGSLAAKAAEEIGRSGRAVLAYQADVRIPSDIQSMLSMVCAQLGLPAVLVNNAGLSQRHVPTVDQDLREWDEVLDTNLKGTLICSAEVGKVMIKNGCGKIVNIASIVAFSGFPQRSAYGPAKAGVVDLTKVLAVEWAPYGITVNAVAPGYVQTPMIEGRVASGEHDLKTLEGRIPLGRLADPDEIAQAVLFLASERASYITGITLPVDGGWLARGE